MTVEGLKKNIEKKKIVILGGGFTGLRIAYLLDKLKYKISLIEKSKNLGGMVQTFCYQYKDEQYRFDFGPHLFFEDYVGEYHDLLGNNLVPITNRFRMCTEKSIYSYPIDPFEILTRTNPITSIAYIIDFLINRVRLKNCDGENDSLDKSLTKRFGKRLYYDFYSQRINASGVVQWTIDGVAISTVSGSNQMHAQLAPDGYDGAIITWNDTRSGQFDVYAQRVNAAGAVQWAADGVSICSAADQQYYPEIIQDPSGGAIITWTDYRTGSADIYAQKIDAIATILWSPADGIAVCNAAEDQTSPKLIPVSTGGTIIAWSDRRDVTYYDIYAQRYEANGNYLWTYRGIPICTEANHQYLEAAVSDGNDCMILIWKDLRSGSEYDLYAQKLSPYGELLWTASGVVISAAPENQVDAAAVADGEGGVIVAWEDYRSGLYEDIFAQRIDGDGYWGCPAPAIMSVRDVPQDEGGFINLAWNASQYDPPGQITEYTIWRALDISQAAMMISGDACVISSGSDLPPSPDGQVIRMEMINGEPYYWEMIDSHSAYYIDTYSKIVQSPFDSTAMSNEYQYFQIIAHTAVPSIFFVSDPDSGYSVDNIAPCPPAMLAGAQEHLPEGLRLTWDPNTEIDLDDYKIYRGMDESFIPGPGNLLAAPCDTFFSVTPSGPSTAKELSLP